MSARKGARQHPEAERKLDSIRRVHAHLGEGARKIACYLRREGYQLSCAGADRLCRWLLQQRKQKSVKRRPIKRSHPALNDYSLL